MKKDTTQDTLDRALTDLYQADIPESFRASWRDAVKREEPSTLKSTHFPVWLKRAALPLAAAVVLVTGTLITGALSPKTYTSMPETVMEDFAASTAMDSDSYVTSLAAAKLGYVQSDEVTLVSAPAPGNATGVAQESADGGAQATDDRKIVRTADLTIASTDFDADYAAILALAESTGGYAASVSTSEYRVSSRTASFSLRIPSGALDACLSGLAGIGRITNRYESADDMTTAYTDTELRLSTQQSKMARLTELLAKAETVEDLLEIENEIADTQYQIDSLETSLRTIDRQVDYASVSVYLEEQTPAETAGAQELTLGERLANSLKASLVWLGDFLANMLVFLIAAAPVLAVVTLILVILRITRRRK